MKLVCLVTFTLFVLLNCAPLKMSLSAYSTFMVHREIIQEIHTIVRDLIYFVPVCCVRIECREDFSGAPYSQILDQLYRWFNQVFLSSKQRLSLWGEMRVWYMLVLSMFSEVFEIELASNWAESFACHFRCFCLSSSLVYISYEGTFDISSSCRCCPWWTWLPRSLEPKWCL